MVLHVPDLTHVRDPLVHVALVGRERLLDQLLQVEGDPPEPGQGCVLSHNETSFADIAAYFDKCTEKSMFFLIISTGLFNMLKKLKFITFKFKIIIYLVIEIIKYNINQIIFF